MVRDKTKKMTQQNSCTTQPKQIFMVLLITETFALFWNFVRDYKTAPYFLDDESGKKFRLIFELIRYFHRSSVLLSRVEVHVQALPADAEVFEASHKPLLFQ
jgi:hypothetical protein